MGFIEKIKSGVEMWRIEKYTKRRPVLSPDYEQKDKQFYNSHYKDGVYFSREQSTNTFKRTASLLRTRSEKITRSSENYNGS
ncbi:hypothetical protein BY458DRAFT_523974 [Sporodiniella umbellata]|nr:hypothetical protein BY458DRAFT_523974 [Sporodiniella umbellata]